MAYPTVQNFTASAVGAPIAAPDGSGVFGLLGGDTVNGLYFQDQRARLVLEELNANIKQLCWLLVWLKGPEGVAYEVVGGSCLDQGS